MYFLDIFLRKDPRKKQLLGTYLDKFCEWDWSKISGVELSIEPPSWKNAIYNPIISRRLLRLRSETQQKINIQYQHRYNFEPAVQSFNTVRWSDVEFHEFHIR